MQVPRNLDLRLLYYRRDLFESISFQRRYQRAFRKPLDVPETWDDLVDTATILTTKAHAGFLFPGRDSGLFGTFYELLVSAGGALFHPDLSPAFDSAAGIWAVDRLVELHRRREVTPAILPLWHYDDISAEYRRGHAAMVTDWPGSHYLYLARATSRVATRTSLALLPVAVRAIQRGSTSRIAVVASVVKGPAAASPRSTRNPVSALARSAHIR